MLEYLTSFPLATVAAVYPHQLSGLCGVSDPHRYYHILALGEQLNRYDSHHKPAPSLAGTLRVEVAQFQVRARHCVYPRESLEVCGCVNWFRLQLMIQALATRTNWRLVFSHFTMVYGSYTLYAHCL
jgi:hypothetical protein